MGGGGAEGDAGVYGSACTLIDQGVVPEDLHGTDGAGEAEGDIRGDMHGRGQGGVVVGTRDGNSPATGERGGQLIRRWSGFAGLEESQASGKKDKDDAEH